MSLSSLIYKRIINDLDLSNNERSVLASKLNSELICAGPHVLGNKICPVTAALISSKKIDHVSNTSVKEYLRKSKVSKLSLVLFYIFFDVPSMLSKKYFEKAILEFHSLLQ